MENNMFNMIDAVSKKLATDNPELSKVFKKMIVGELKVNSGQEMKELLIKMQPTKRKEIEANFDVKEMDKNLSKLQDALAMMKNFNFTA